MGVIRARTAVRLIWSVWLCALAAPLLWANESPVVGIGGAYHPMRGESSVRLVREFIRIEFSPRLARTVVEFEFRNEGPPQTVAMGFPEQVVYDRGRYRRFRAEVDGRPLAARPTRWVEESPQTLWARWWVSKVQFAHGERHIIRVRYQEPPGTDEAGYTYRYLFGTGRTWKGAIGSIDVVLVLKGFPPAATVYERIPPADWQSGSGLTWKANRLAWRFQNWEPDEDANLDLSVSPHITDIAFGKETPDPPLEWDLRQGYLDADLGELAHWVKAGVAWNPQQRACSVQRNGKTLILTVGSNEAMLLPAKTRVRLPFAPYLARSPYAKGRYLRVPVRAVCEAFDLRVHAEKDKIGNWNVHVSGMGT
jgi:hypothetical protein